MNETLKNLYERKSVRVFTDREISLEDKHAILRAASEAPTAGKAGGKAKEKENASWQRILSRYVTSIIAKKRDLVKKRGGKRGANGGSARLAPKCPREEAVGSEKARLRGAELLISKRGDQTPL